MTNSYSFLRVGVVASVLSVLFLASLPLTGKLGHLGTAATVRNYQTPNAIRFAENFNGVAAPALPSGWTTSRVGTNTLFETRLNGTPSSNALFTNNPASAGSAEVTSPPISLGNSRARLSFRHAYQTDYRGDDGGVIEISINSGPFQDVVQIGGEFVGGRYIGLIGSAATGNPLLGRQAWNRDSDGYKATIVNLPLSLANTTVKFRWRYGTGDQFEGIGWYIDDVKVEDFIPSRITFREDFDSVSAPNLPSNWTTAATDEVRTFRTHTEANYTSPNSVFTPVPAAAGTAAIISPPIQIGGNLPKLTFQHHYACDAPTEGGVLDISINGGPWRDIVEAGGQFTYGGYTATITANQNPLMGRDAWSGSTQGMIITEVVLPPSAFRQSVRFKWEWGTDPFILSIGWWIDSIVVTEELSGANLAGISIPDTGAANPYPSEIIVSDHVGLISKVNVNLVNFSHASPDDVDLMLVSPSGRKVVLMSDAGGGNTAENISLTFDDRAPAQLPDTSPIAGGVYRPTDFEPGDNFPPPAPGAIAPSRTLGLLNGSDPNGAWKLFAVDDNGSNTGSISGGWSLSIETTPDMVTIPEVGVAEPYPSQRLVSGRPGTVTKVRVTLRNFSHSSPDDLDVLLVGPNGRRIVLMSDVGGATEVGSLDLTIDDAAGSALPDGGPLVNGSFKPTNYDSGDPFPAPAPGGGPTGATLGTFFGSPPNGMWQLFVVDDSGGDLGSVSGEWDLDVESSTGACVFGVSPTVLSYPASGGTGAINITMPAGCSWSASADSSFVTVTTAASGEGSGSLGYSVSANTGPARTGAINITNGVLTRSVLIQQPAGEARRSPFDFDGDGKTDISVFRPSGGEWWYVRSSNGQVSAGVFGGTTDVITPGDFTGDGKSDFAFFRPSTGEWFILKSENNSFTAFPFGQNGDIPAPADYDNDGKLDAAVFRAGTWYIAPSAGGAAIVTGFGAAGDQPVPRDYDNDGRADIAIVRNQDGDKQWWINRSSAGLSAFVFGNASDKAVPGDYTGDGKADAALWRESTGEWLILRSEDFSYFAFPFGRNGDSPVTGDYDGDGRFDAAVFRPSGATWFINLTGGSGVQITGFGAASDQPVPGAYVR
jgi:subtilisin-like proprotein convertase family protein